MRNEERSTYGGNYGVLTEQGFPVGQFGFDKLNEKDEKAIKEAANKEEK